MTVPIFPGPFAFLGEAGQAAGAIGEQLTEHKRYAQDQAQKAMDHLDRLVQLGILPADTITTPAVQHLSKVAGYTPTQPGQVLPQPKEIAAREVAGMAPGARRDIALGLPTEAAGLAEDVKARAIKAIPAGGAAERAFAGTKTESEAAAHETAQTITDQVNTAVGKDVQQLIGSDPNQARLAAMASLGTLPYLVAQLTSSRQFRSESDRLLISVLGDISSDHRLRVEAYYNRERDALKKYSDSVQHAQDALENGMPGASQELVDQAQKRLDDARANWEKLNAPPSVNESAEPWLTTIGSSPDEFKQGIGDIINRMFGNKRQQFGDVSGGGGTTAPAPPPAEPDARALSVDDLISSIVNGKATGVNLADAERQGVYGSRTIMYVMEKARRTMSPEKFQRFEADYTKAKGGR